ncbi:protein ENHANCED DOWNY MILDEW 2-like [Tripterygium wilfordii]|uniref:protein ENHANCED DOWNY MILDEW 2-like n=1 Tax=Tripterygium wilfordii TaxID=458696 RepID=UPI0018F8267D|nr:protein ENHANCED DOWNY MILDEW 2-like [Tripterygium wilfordii]
MASSDEEGEILPLCVTDYFFEDNNGTVVSFSILPIQWNETEVIGDLEAHVFLRGTCDNGLQSVHKKVIAWRFELSYVHPEISVLSNDKNWVTLLRPKRSYETIARTILVTVHWLHLSKRNLEGSEKSPWNCLLKAFSSYEVQPTENDLLIHKSLIKEAANRDGVLATSKHLITLMEKSFTNETLYEDIQTTKKPEFIVDWDDDDDNDGEEVAEQEFSFETVCSICDDGGDILNCEGWCLRAFHVTIAAGVQSSCATLGFNYDAEVEAIPTFLCDNCVHRQHQCYACGKLGSSAKSSAQEVFPCVSATCGHFYHPGCVAKLLHADHDSQAKEMQVKIAAGESFICPIHKCCVCKQVEDKKIYDLQFALCRRCPKAYHRKCLPRGITFGSIQRAWEGLLPNRILIYCMEHEIIDKLGTPARDHLIFPGVHGKRIKSTSELLSKNRQAVATKSSMSFYRYAADKTVVKRPKLVLKTRRIVEAGDSTQRVKKRSPGDFDQTKKPHKIGVGRKLLKDDFNSVSYGSFKMGKPKLSYRNVNSSANLKSNSIEFKERKDIETEQRMLALMRDSTLSLNMEEFMKKRKIPATYRSKSALDKTVTMGLIEGSVKAVRTALQNLKDGCSIEEAKTVCDPSVLNQIAIWKRKLGVYLSPFLHGMRYTSFGRHFTNNKKLKEIAERLHRFVQDGDTIVDFCCGSNDFSCIMKEKLEKTGKLCAFKNYDLMPAKNDFNFEKRDWMSVQLEELPNGSQLIMGLNPPFGVKASRANEFVRSALKFRPKLIILIVPKETKRLDEISDYDLIWEDDKLLSGKSFYLPGSVDVFDKQLEQWNLNPPPLYLWSRSDWTARHKAIAQECNNMPKMQEEMYRKETNLDQSSFDHPINCTLPCKHKEGNLPGYNDIEVGNHSDQGMKQSYESLNEITQEDRGRLGCRYQIKKKMGYLWLLMMCALTWSYPLQLTAQTSKVCSTTNHLMSMSLPLREAMEFGT